MSWDQYRSSKHLGALPKPQRRWGRVTWWLSSLFVAGLLAVGISALAEWRSATDPATITPPRLTIYVSEVGSGRMLADVAVSSDSEAVFTGADGMAALAFPLTLEVIRIDAEGYQPAFGRAGPGIDPEQRIALSPAT